MCTIHLIGYFEKSQGKHTLLGWCVGEDPGISKRPPSCTIWTMLSLHFSSVKKKKKILLSLLRGTPGAVPWQEGKRFSSQMKGPCAWQRRASQEGVCGVGGRSAGIAGALNTLLLASTKVLQQRPPNDHPWNLRAGWSASNEKNNAWQVCQVTPEGNSDFWKKKTKNYKL